MIIVMKNIIFKFNWLLVVLYNVVLYVLLIWDGNIFGNIFVKLVVINIVIVR